jgi:hypothetical protein
MPDQIVAEGVEPIGPVERQGRDLVAAGIFDQVGWASVRHFFSSCSKCLIVTPRKPV